MEFRLYYRGPLLATTGGDSRVKHKHEIRRQLHKQLAELWKVQQPLLNISQTVFSDPDADKSSTTITQLEYIARRYERCGFRFVPLVSHTFGLVCGLEILFLRRDDPGALVMQGGDRDNRIKTLFDALRIPGNCSEVPSGPVDGENPFFCLLENDSMITELSVSTDRLLIPAISGEHQNEVLLIIKVKTKIVAPDRAYIEFSF